MKVIEKKTDQSAIQVGDVVRVTGNTSFNVLPLGTLATVARFDEDDFIFRIDTYDVFDYAAEGDLEFIARPSTDKAPAKVTSVVVELDVEDIKHIAGALYETETYETDAYLKAKGIAETAGSNSHQYQRFHEILQEVV